MGVRGDVTAGGAYTDGAEPSLSLILPQTQVATVVDYYNTWMAVGSEGNEL